MQGSIVDLFHQKSDSVLKNRSSKIKSISIMLSIYNESIEALENFYKENLSFFDAQVGETSCQMRAYKILLLNTTNNEFFSKSIIKSTLASLIRKKEILVKLLSDFCKTLKDKSGHYDKYLDKPISLYNFFEKTDILIELNQDILFIIQCYILTKYAVRDVNSIPMAIDYNKIGKIFNISNTQSKLLIHKYQKNIAESSCKFIFNLTEQIFSKESFFCNVLSNFNKIAEEQRPVLPAYYSSKIILTHAKKTLKPILLVVNRYYRENYLDTTHLLFVPNSSGNFICKNENLSFYKNISCLVIKGEAKFENINNIENSDVYKNRLSQMGIERLVLYNMAKHPQYTGNRLASLSDNPFKCFDQDNSIFFRSHLKELTNLEKELLEYKACAEQYGCCMMYKNLFFLKHIFCDLVYNHLDRTRDFSAIDTKISQAYI